MVSHLVGSTDIVLVDTEHLSEPLVSEVNVSWVHLVEHELVTVVALLSQLCLQLIEVDRHVLLVQLLLLEHVSPLLFGVIDASLARFTLLA